MQVLEQLERRITSAEQLLSIVKTMKALAVANMRHYERAVESLDDYFKTVEMALQVVLWDLGNTDSQSNETKKNKATRRGSNKTLGIVFGSDYGFAGRFNEDITSFAIRELDLRETRNDNRSLICVGEQILIRMEHEEQPVRSFFGIPSSLAGINILIQKLLLEIDHARTNGELGQVVLFYNRPVAGQIFTQQIETLIPISAEHYKNIKKEWPTKNIPRYTIERSALMAAILRQYIYVSLYRGAVLSLAAENSSRLSSMHSAGKNIEELLERVKSEYRSNRQSAITEELLDIAAGFTALESESKGKSKIKTLKRDDLDKQN